MVYYIVKGVIFLKSKYILMAEMFKALGDENRLKLLNELKGGEKNAGELLESLSVTQPTLSHHMKILCDSGIVDARREGKWTYYSISKEGKKELLDIINSLLGGKYVPSFDIDDIILTEEAGEIKPEKVKKTATKKPAKKKTEKKKEAIEVVSETYEEATEEISKVPEEKEEPKEERRERNMPSWLF